MSFDGRTVLDCLLKPNQHFCGAMDTITSAQIQIVAVDPATSRIIFLWHGLKPFLAMVTGDQVEFHEMSVHLGAGMFGPARLFANQGDLFGTFVRTAPLDFADRNALATGLAKILDDGIGADAIRRLARVNAVLQALAVRHPDFWEWAMYDVEERTLTIRTWKPKLRLSALDIYDPTADLAAVRYKPLIQPSDPAVPIDEKTHFGPLQYLELKFKRGDGSAHTRLEQMSVLPDLFVCDGIDIMSFMKANRPSAAA